MKQKLTEEEKKARKREYNRRYNEKNPSRERSRKWRATNPRRSRSSELLRLYGITLADYDAMLNTQDFHCALCPTTHLKNKKLHVDHCHATGRVRGLLCFECNTGLGKFKDNTDTLLRAVAYLKAAA